MAPIPKQSDKASSQKPLGFKIHGFLNVDRVRKFQHYQTGSSKLQIYSYCHLLQPQFCFSETSGSVWTSQTDNYCPNKCSIGFYDDESA
jgi:hypothetical protein